MPPPGTAAKPEPTHHMWSRFGGALACFVLGLMCFVVIGPTPFNDRCSHYVLTGYTGCFTWPQFWGSVFLIGFGFGFLAFGSWAAVAAAGFAREKQMLNSGGAAPAQAIIGVLAVISIISSIVATVKLIKPFETYQTNDHGDRNAWVAGWTIDVWNVTLGYFILVSFLPFGFALAQMLNLITTKPAMEFQSNAEMELPVRTSQVAVPNNSDTTPLRTESEGGPAPEVEPEDFTMPLISSVVFLLMCFTITTIITPIWNFSQNSHMLGFSEFAWGWFPLGGVRPATAGGAHYTQCTCDCQEGWANYTQCTSECFSYNRYCQVGDCQVGQVGNGECSNCTRDCQVGYYDRDCQVGWANYTQCIGSVDYDLCKDHSHQCPWFNFKIYTDTTVFFFALICGIVAGFALHKQKVPGLRKRTNLKMGGEFGYGMTGIEAITMGAILVLALFWAYYWGMVYGRFWDKDYPEDLWPLRGSHENFTIEKTYDTWYIGQFGHGPFPPWEPLAHDQLRRPTGQDDETPACDLFSESTCGTASYCFLNEKGLCKLARCTDIGDNQDLCRSSGWCHWPSNESSSRRLQHGGSGGAAEVGCVPLYDGLEEEHRTGHGYLHVACRASGHMASLFMSLVVLAAAKGSPLLKAMGLSWEEVLPFHRILGYIAFLAVTGHMLLWWWKWILDGTFWANIFPDTNYWVWITPVWNHFEDFAVMMVQYSWFLFAAAIAVVPWRREYYRLFYVLHHGAIWMALMGICHAWAFHYFLLPGILLWWADRLTRLIQAAEPVSVRKFQSLKSGIVHLELCAPRFAARFRAPNYGFLRVPGVASSGWHPFTANVVGKNVTFLIKDMGGWTKELAALAKTGDPKAAAGAALFGPFGGVSSRFFPAAPPMVLVAGGIGVTPVASVFMEAVFERRLTSVYFVWIVQSVDLLDMPFVSELLERAKEEKGAHVRLFVTRAKPAEITGWQEKNAPGPNTKIIGGRPNLPALFDEVDQESGRTPGSGAVFACGPDVMQKEAMALGQERDYGESHVETFLF